MAWKEAGLGLLRGRCYRGFCSRTEACLSWNVRRCSLGDGYHSAPVIMQARYRSYFSVATSVHNLENTNNLPFNIQSVSTVLKLYSISAGWTPGFRLMTTTTEGPHPFDSKGPKHHSGRWRWSVLILFIPGISAFGLGCWQILRRKWKMELLDHRRERLKDDVVPLGLATTSIQNIPNQTYSDVIQSLEYRRVQCKGVFQENRSLFLGPRGRTNHGVTERGYFIITPLVPAEVDHQNVQVPVLVNRGWVPGTWRDNPPQAVAETTSKNLDLNDQPTSKKGLLTKLWGKKQQTLQKQSTVKETTVIGVIRSSENPNMFVPPNEPASGQWFFVDVSAMAHAVGLPGDTIYVEALQEKSTDFKGKQYPDPKDPETLIRSSVMPQDHLSYAFTWFALSGATTFMAWKRLSK